MSQTFAENNNENKNECCVCYNDNSEEEGKLIECCTNKHILCVGCFHKSYERKCECPLCRELMYRPEIMTDVELYAYFGAKLALNDRRAREEQQRQIRLAEAERQRAIAERQRELQLAEAERHRQEQLQQLQVRKTERIQRIQQRNDELLGQIAINNAEIENINNLDLDAYNTIYSPNFELRPSTLEPTSIISDSDSDSDNDSVEIYQSQPRPVQIHQVARPLQQPVQEPRPLTMHQRILQQLPARPVQQPARPVQQPARPVQQPARPVVEQRRSRTYARDNLLQNELLVQTLSNDRMVVRYDRLNDVFIRVCNNTVYQTLNRASAAHALEVGLLSTPNAWTTFKRLDGSRIDNL